MRAAEVRAAVEEVGGEITDSVQQVLAALEAGCQDAAEATLFEAVKRKEAWAIVLYLAHYGRGRGYFLGPVEPDAPQHKKGLTRP